MHHIHSPSPIVPPRLHSIVSLHDRLATRHDVQPRTCLLAPLWCPPSLVAEEAAADGSARIHANNAIHPRFLVLRRAWCLVCGFRDLPLLVGVGVGVGILLAVGTSFKILRVLLLIVGAAAQGWTVVDAAVRAGIAHHILAIGAGDRLLSADHCRLVLLVAACSHLHVSARQHCPRVSGAPRRHLSGHAPLLVRTILAGLESEARLEVRHLEVRRREAAAVTAVDHVAWLAHGCTVLLIALNAVAGAPLVAGVHAGDQRIGDRLPACVFLLVVVAAA